MRGAFPFYTAAAEEVLGFLSILWSSIRANVAPSNSSHLGWQSGVPHARVPGGSQEHPAPIGMLKANRQEQGGISAAMEPLRFLLRKKKKIKRGKKKVGCLMSQDRRA